MNATYESSKYTQVHCSATKTYHCSPWGDGVMCDPQLFFLVFDGRSAMSPGCRTP